MRKLVCLSPGTNPALGKDEEGDVGGMAPQRWGTLLVSSHIPQHKQAAASANVPYLNLVLESLDMKELTFLSTAGPSPQPYVYTWAAVISRRKTAPIFLSPAHMGL